ncbi:MAG: hypothetical protein PUB21_10465 [Bacteroidales bacterium]|nr:hypothetical protein [Bacteroidales bacterium]
MKRRPATLLTIIILSLGYITPFFSQSVIHIVTKEDFDSGEMESIGYPGMARSSDATSTPQTHRKKSGVKQVKHSRTRKAPSQRRRKYATHSVYNRSYYREMEKMQRQIRKDAEKRKKQYRSKSILH